MEKLDISPLVPWKTAEEIKDWYNTTFYEQSPGGQWTAQPDARVSVILASETGTVVLPQMQLQVGHSLEQIVRTAVQDLRRGIPGHYPLDPTPPEPPEQFPQQSIIQTDKGRLEDVGEKITYRKKDYLVSLYNQNGEPHFEVLRLEDGKIMDERYKTREHLIREYKALTGM